MFRLNYLYAIMWIAIFGAAGWYAAFGDLENYDSRKGRFMAELLVGIKGAIGGYGVLAICLAIGFVFAAWSIWGKEE